MPHFLSIAEANRRDLDEILGSAARLKKEWTEALSAGMRQPPRLEGMVLAMIFEKPSLRTRFVRSGDVFAGRACDQFERQRDWKAGRTGKYFRPGAESLPVGADHSGAGLLA